MTEFDLGMAGSSGGDVRYQSDSGHLPANFYLDAQLKALDVAGRSTVQGLAW